MSRLILFPVPIGAEALNVSLPEANLQLLYGCNTFIVEELRSARRFLKKAGFPRPLDTLCFHLLNEHTPPEAIGDYLGDASSDEDIGLFSEAGLPCVADPGNLVTRMAQQRGISIVPLVGPSSIMLALMASGLNGQQFACNGYLPVDRHQRAAAIRKLESLVAHGGATQIFIEAPYRNNQMLQSLAETCHPETLICVACDLTLPTQTILTRSAAQWRKQQSHYDFHKRPTVFLIGR